MTTISSKQRVYETYIVKSRYARYLDEKNRRENWPETICRYFDFMGKHLKDSHGYVLTKELRQELEDAVVNLEVMPSMRALMTAGEALSRDHTAGYNCSYIAVDDVRAFDEAMNILMNGTGVGFSVERQFITKLPEVPSKIINTESVIVVEDSKEGWSSAFNQYLANLYSGHNPKVDYSKVRPAGARLKTFGGRASGPEPLKDLFKFCLKTFQGSVGRKMNSLECHDIMTFIGQVVVVGGVRRSAMISLSNLSDERMRHAKAGAWWEANPQRALANNSACYTEKPEVSVFMAEWLAMHNSKSGERGIFNREAAKKVVAKSGRRNPEFEFGTNPCCFTGDTLVAVSDGRGPTPIRDLAFESNGTVTFDVLSAVPEVRNDGISPGTMTWSRQVKTAVAKFTAVKPVFKVTLSDGGSFEATNDHPLATKRGNYVMVENSVGFPLEGLDTNDANLMVVSVVPVGEKDVYDLTVEDNHNFFIITSQSPNITGLLVHNSEIILRSKQFCNLSEGVAREWDTEATLANKVRLSTILGTFQSTLTHFPYLRNSWTENTAEERLLGISLTGVLDSVLLNNPDDKDLPARLERLRDLSIETNKKLAAEIGIPQSAATTCVKPSGTVSQAVDCASGLHARHAKYYFRRVRGDIKDPLTNFMIQQGIPNEPCVMKPDTTVVFTFPKKAPEGALLREDLSAIQHLKLWLVYQRHWCEHKPSVTISVKDEESPAVAAFVWEHFDEMSGVSFLPYDGGSYRQAPYEECTEAEYEEMTKLIPETLDWDSVVEVDDNVEGAQMLACSAGVCEI